MHKLLALGKGKAIIVEIMNTKFDGTPLLNKNNNQPYKNIRLIVKDEHDNRAEIYDPIWGGDTNKAKYQQIVDAINKDELKEKFAKGTLNDADLIGAELGCVISIRKGKNGYPDQNTIALYTKNTQDFTQLLLNGATIEKQAAKPTQEDEDDNIPW